MQAPQVLPTGRPLATPSLLSRPCPTWRPSTRHLSHRGPPRPASVAEAPRASPSSPLPVVAHWPTPAETARTIMAITVEGTLSTLSEDGSPLGTPVSYTLSPDGTPLLRLGALQLAHLRRSPKCSLMVQPAVFPARGVASVALVGQLRDGAPAEAVEGEEVVSHALAIDHCLFFGGLSARTEEVSQESLAAAVPDVLRNCASTLVQLWNSERAEDLYRVVSDFLGVAITEMTYAELLWVDRLGMCVRCELAGKPASVVRVPFYRAVIDERDARSVITMAAQLAWEHERNYTPAMPPAVAAVTGLVGGV